MAERGDNKIKLQVANARSGDSGRGIARIPRQLLAELNIGEGAPVAIEGERLTTAIAVGPYDEDEGLDVIRLRLVVAGCDVRLQPMGRDGLRVPASGGPVVCPPDP